MIEVSTALLDPAELEKCLVEESPRVGFSDCNKEQEFEGEKKDDGAQEALMIHDDTIMVSLLALDDTTMMMLDLMLGGQR